MQIDLVLSARDAHDLTTIVSTTLHVDADGGASSEPIIETIVRYARAAAERLRDETQPAVSSDAPGASANDFIPWATYLGRARSGHR